LSSWRRDSAGKKAFSSLSVCGGKEEDAQCCSKQHRFILKEMAPKIFQFPNRSLICDLFNQVLDCPSNFNNYAIKPLI